MTTDDVTDERVSPGLPAERAVVTLQWYRRGYFTTDTLYDFFVDGARRHPTTTLTFETARGRMSATLPEVVRRADRVAAGLRAAGLGRGDVVVSQVPNWLEGAVLFCACVSLGVIIVPVIHIYGPNELRFIVRNSGARCLVVPDRWGRISYLERLRELGDDAPEVVVVIGEELPDRAMAWSALEAHEPIANRVAVRADDVCLILYTSGTSARPKGVRHTHNSVRWEVVGTTGMARWDDSVVLMNPAPAGHMSGLLGTLRPYAIGADTVYMDAWDPARAVRLIDEFGVTACNSPSPLYLTTLLTAAAEAGSKLTSLAEYAIGGAAVPPAVIEAADRYGIAAYRTYGSSEHPTVSSGVRTDPLHRRAYTDGRVTPGTHVRIVDEQGRELPFGQEGEIAAIGPEQLLDYTDEENNRRAFLADGYFLTGDIGVLVEDGFLTITDRKKDIIIRGGENLSSREIEQLVAAHPAVRESAAIAVPDERYGEKVGVVVVLKPGATLDLAALRQHFRDSAVAKQKTPEYIQVVADLPRTPSGKVKKSELRAHFRPGA